MMRLAVKLLIRLQTSQEFHHITVQRQLKVVKKLVEKMMNHVERIIPKVKSNLKVQY